MDLLVLTQKKTHIIIINALADLHAKIDKLEKEIAELKK
jgi:hypothetical protein